MKGGVKFLAHVGQTAEINHKVLQFKAKPSGVHCNAPVFFT